LDFAFASKDASSPSRLNGRYVARGSTIALILAIDQWFLAVRQIFNPLLDRFKEAVIERNELLGILLVLEELSQLFHLFGVYLWAATGKASHGKARTIQLLQERPDIGPEGAIARSGMDQHQVRMKFYYLLNIRLIEVSYGWQLAVFWEDRVDLDIFRSAYHSAARNL